MPARLPPNLLDRSAEESARLLALSYLDQSDRAERRLANPSDREALHDFRVGLRRLRSTLSAYRVQLTDSVTPPMRRRIRDLARATSAGRDTEVQLEWLSKQTERLGAEDIPGFYWMAGRLEDRKEEMLDDVTARVGRKYQKTAAKLRRTLGVLHIELVTGQGQAPATFREATGALTRQHVARLRQDLGSIRGSADAEQAHRTRISLKRLRYLLEPIARRNRRAAALVRLFREGQDMLGEHHDMHVLSTVMVSLRRGVATSNFAGVERGLSTVSRLAEEDATAAFERFQSLWGDDMASWILTRAEELGQSMEQRPAAAAVTEAAPAIQPAAGSHKSAGPVPDELPTAGLQLEIADAQPAAGKPDRIRESRLVTRD
jgi:CHAD domain-containing protein